MKFILKEGMDYFFKKYPEQIGGEKWKEFIKELKEREKQMLAWLRKDADTKEIEEVCRIFNGTVIRANHKK